MVQSSNKWKGKFKQKEATCLISILSENAAKGQPFNVLKTWWEDEGGVGGKIQGLLKKNIFSKSFPRN